MLSHEARDAWVEWLRSIRWGFWTSPTFRHPTSPYRALRAVEGWLAPLAPSVYAAAGLQYGPLGNRLHLHVLVGGIGRRPLIRTLLERSWRRGRIELDGYRPRRGGVEYLVRQADEIELVGALLVTFRPRKRGGRAR